MNIKHDGLLLSNFPDTFFYSFHYRPPRRLRRPIILTVKNIPTLKAKSLIFLSTIRGGGGFIMKPMGNGSSLDARNAKVPLAKGFAILITHKMPLCLSRGIGVCFHFPLFCIYFYCAFFIHIYS